MKLKVIELFGGIGACSKALQNIGIEPEIVDYVEIDKYAVASFNAIHNTTFEPQDITTWNKNLECDLIMHGSPCQDFSLAGKQAGGDKDSGTRSSLMYETLRIVENIKPKYVIWENVKNLVSKKHIHNFEAYLEQMSELGYHNYWKVLNAKNYGIPQNRERVYTVSIRADVDKGFEFPEAQELKLKLKDMLEDNVDEKYYLSDKMIKYISATGTANFNNHDSKINLDIARPVTTDPNKRAGTTNYLSDELPDNYDLSKVENFNGKNYLRNFGTKGKLQDGETCDTLTASMGGSRMQYHRGNVQSQSIQTIDCTGGEGHGVVMPGLRIRKLTPKECWRLMGFDDESFEKAQPHNSNTQLYKQAGNSIVVNVLMAIFEKLLKD
jgi:DNA (cytosine-5)-methyltransferase 1